MKKQTIFLLAITICAMASCRLFISNKGTYRVASAHNNVCKKLYGDVVLYAIFVDTKSTNTQPWSDYDIKSTLDSIQMASHWLENKAAENGMPLNIKVKYHQNKKKIPIAAELPRKTLSGTIFFPNIAVGLQRLSHWANKVAKIAGDALPPDTSSIITTKNKLNDKERLIARLRDIYKTDNVVLMFFLNNYFKEEISVTLNTESFTDIEYAVVSFKNPTVIAHEFLHFFGAWDLYITPFDKKRSIRKKKKMAMKEFPNEVMAFTYRDLDSLEISPFTKYLIGWENKLDEKYERMFLGKNIHVLKY